MTDHDLIRDFTATRSEQAFRRLVDRHCDLVFSVATRVTRDPDLARDVAQQLFCKLAAKPKSVAPGVPLAAWLHRSTRSLAIDLVRSEAARRRREQSFSPAMNHPEPSPDWSRLEPVIDSLIDELPELERRAVVLRFYEKKSHGAIGSLLGLSEEAARKRLDRALEKLRALLAKRGIATSSAALASILPAHATISAPVGLSASLSSTALSISAATAAGTASTSILAIIMSNKTVSAAAALLLVAGVTAVAIPALNKDKNSPPSASASASAPAAPGDTASGTGADAGGNAARAKAKTNAATARLTEKYGDSRTKLSGHIGNELVGMMEDLLGIMDTAGESGFGEAMFNDPADALGPAAESITLTDEQKAKVSELQAASTKREIDKARKMIADLRKEPEALMEVLLLTDALKRGQITREEFDSAKGALDFPEDALELAFDDMGESSIEDDPILIEELLRVLDEAQAKAYQEAIAAEKSAKAAEVGAKEEEIMSLEEFEKQITSTRKIVRGLAQMMEGITDGGGLMDLKQAKD